MRDGELNGRSVLTRDRVTSLKKEYRAQRNGRWNRQGHGNYSAYSTAALAAREGVAQSTMWSALTESTWRKK